MERQTPVLHDNVNLCVKAETIYDLLRGGQRVDLGQVPETVEAEHYIFVSCPELARTCVVAVDSVLIGQDGSRHGYSMRAVEHHKYLAPSH